MLSRGRFRDRRISLHVDIKIKNPTINLHAPGPHPFPVRAVWACLRGPRNPPFSGVQAALESTTIADKPATSRWPTILGVAVPECQRFRSAPPPKTPVPRRCGPALGKRFPISSTSNIQGDVPAGNILAMREAVDNFEIYT